MLRLVSCQIQNGCLQQNTNIDYREEHPATHPKNRPINPIPYCRLSELSMTLASVAELILDAPITARRSGWRMTTSCSRRLPTSGGVPWKAEYLFAGGSMTRTRSIRSTASRSSGPTLGLTGWKKASASSSGDGSWSVCTWGTSGGKLLDQLPCCERGLWWRCLVSVWNTQTVYV